MYAYAHIYVHILCDKKALGILQKAVLNCYELKKQASIAPNFAKGYNIILN